MSTRLANIISVAEESVPSAKAGDILLLDRPDARLPQNYLKKRMLESSTKALERYGVISSNEEMNSELG